LLKFNGYLCNFYFGPVQALWNKLHLQSSSSRRACQLWAWSEELQWLLIYTWDLDAKQLCVTNPPAKLCLSHPLHFILWHLSAYIWFYYSRELVSWTDVSLNSIWSTQEKTNNAPNIEQMKIKQSQSILVQFVFTSRE
jgi:hypothetical protein